MSCGGYDRWDSVKAGCGACGGRFGTSARTLCIGEVSDLTRLLKRSPTFDAIRIVAPLPLDDSMQWEQRLFRLYDECGCTAGSVAVLCVLAGTALRALTQRLALGWEAVATVVLMCFGAAVAGKVIGIAFSRWRLRAAVRVLAEILASHVNVA